MFASSIKVYSIYLKVLYLVSHKYTCFTSQKATYYLLIQVTSHFRVHSTVTKMKVTQTTVTETQHVSIQLFTALAYCQSLCMQTRDCSFEVVDARTIENQ
jgi:hypothetical protein